MTLKAIKDNCAEAISRVHATSSSQQVQTLIVKVWPATKPTHEGTLVELDSVKQTQEFSAVTSAVFTVRMS